MPKKILVVYYSLTGNTKLIAEIISEGINADLLALKPIKDLNPEGGMKFILGGYQSKMHKKPKLEPIKINPLEYELIFLGTPVRAWTFSPPLRSFLAQFDLTGKNVAFWVCCLGKGKKASERFKKHLKNTNIIGNNIFPESTLKNRDEIGEKVTNWAKKIVSNM